MSTQTPTDQVFAVDRYALFQPIRLPAAEFRELHEQTAETLQAFVERHRERFPQQAGGSQRR